MFLDQLKAVFFIEVMRSFPLHLRPQPQSGQLSLSGKRIRICEHLCSDSRPLTPLCNGQSVDDQIWISVDAVFDHRFHHGHKFFARPGSKRKIIRILPVFLDHLFHSFQRVLISHHIAIQLPDHRRIR